MRAYVYVDTEGELEALAKLTFDLDEAARFERGGRDLDLVKSFYRRALPRVFIWIGPQRLWCASGCIGVSMARVASEERWARVLRRAIVEGEEIDVENDRRAGQR